MIEGKSCAINIKKLTNNKENDIFVSNGGSSLEDFMVLTVLSYALLEDKIYLSSEYKESNHITHEDIIGLNSIAIILSFENAKSGHAVCFYTCNNINKYYDDEYGIITFDWKTYLNYIIEKEYISYFCYMDGILLPLLEKNNILYLLTDNKLTEVDHSRIEKKSLIPVFNLLKLKIIPPEEEYEKQNKNNLINLFTNMKTIECVPYILKLVDGDELFNIACKTNMEIFIMIENEMIENQITENKFKFFSIIGRITDIPLFDYIFTKYIIVSVLNIENILISAIEQENNILFIYIIEKYKSKINILQENFLTYNDENILTTKKTSYLHMGIRCKEVVYYFIDNGGDINIVDEDNNSPIMLAIILKLYDIAKILIKKGGDINIINKFGYNSLDLAIIFNMEDIAIKLCEMDLYINNLYINNLNMSDIIRSFIDGKNILVIKLLLIKNSNFIDKLIENSNNYIYKSDTVYLNDAINALIENNNDDILLLSKFINKLDEYNFSSYITNRQKINTNRMLTIINSIKLLNVSTSFDNMSNNILNNSDYENIKLIIGIINYDKLNLDKFNKNELLLRSVSSSTYMNGNYLFFIKYIIENGANILIEDVDKNNLLLISINNMELELVNYFIDKIDIGMKNSNMDNVFHINLKTMFNNSDYITHSKKIYLLLLNQIRDRGIIKKMLTIDKNKDNMTVIDLLIFNSINSDNSPIKKFYIDNLDEITGIDLYEETKDIPTYYEYSIPFEEISTYKKI